MKRSKNEEKVVLVLDDDSRLKGVVERFDPTAPRVDLREVDGTGHQVAWHDVDVQEVVVAFVVRDLALWRSKPLSEEDLGNRPGDGPETPSGTPVRVTLRWGETMEGVIPRYGSRRPWFWLYPFPDSNRSGNLERVYLARRGIGRIERLEPRG